MKEKKTCPICSLKFIPKRFWQKWCSVRCRKRAYNEAYNKIAAELRDDE